MAGSEGEGRKAKRKIGGKEPRRRESGSCEKRKGEAREEAWGR